MPVLGLDFLEAFMEVHDDVHFEGLVHVFGQVLPALGIVELAPGAEGIQLGGDDALGSQVLLVLVAVEGPAGFGRGEAAAHDHHAVLHVGGPGHGVVHHDALLAGLVPGVPDGLGGEDVGAEGLGGVLVIEGLAFVIVVVVLDAVGAGEGARADGGPGGRRDGRQVEAFSHVAAFLDEAAEVVKAAFLEEALEAFGDETVEADERCALSRRCH